MINWITFSNQKNETILVNAAHIVAVEPFKVDDTSQSLVHLISGPAITIREPVEVVVKAVGEMNSAQS